MSLMEGLKDSFVNAGEFGAADMAFIFTEVFGAHGALNLAPCAVGSYRAAVPAVALRVFWCIAFDRDSRAI